MNNYLFKINELEKYKIFLQKIKNFKHAIILNSDDELLLTNIAKLCVMQNVCKGQEPPCLFCENCKKVLDKNAVDIEYYGFEKSMLVEDSENIVNSSYIVPLEFSQKFFVLQMDLANVQAQNKLLKVIEEPQNFDRFILLSTNIDSVLPTLKSRCEVYTIPKFTNEELKSIFDYNIGEAKKVNFSVEYANRNLTSLDKIYNDESFVEIYTLAQNMLTNMITSADILYYSSKITAKKDQIKTFLNILLSFYRDIICLKYDKKNEIQNKEMQNVLQVCANGSTEFGLLKIISEIENSITKLSSNANINGIIDNLLLKILEIKYICK